MKRNLGRHNIGTNRPSVLHHGGGTLVTRCFNTKNHHALKYNPEAAKAIEHGITGRRRFFHREGEVSLRKPSF
jgi:hypothetical protein